jgi:hypothetical protein
MAGQNHRGLLSGSSLCMILSGHDPVASACVFAPLRLRVEFLTL